MASRRTRSMSSGDSRQEARTTSDIATLLQQMQTQMLQAQEAQTQMQKQAQQAQTQIQLNIQEAMAKQEQNLNEGLNILRSEIKQTSSTISAFKEEIVKRQKEQQTMMQDFMLHIENRMDLAIAEMEQKNQKVKEMVEDEIVVYKEEMENKMMEQKLVIENRIIGIEEKGEQLLTEQSKLKKEFQEMEKYTYGHCEKIGLLEHKTVEIEGTLSRDKIKVQEEIKLWRNEDLECFESMKKELKLLKQSGTRMDICDGKCTKQNYIKVELWPRFKGVNDRLLPMTYLKNILHLAKDIDNQDQALNLIRLTLQETALSWFELCSDRITDLKTFEAEFIKQYWSTEYQDRLKVQLLTGKYVEGMNTREMYACTLYNKCKYIESLTEAEITKYLTNHFLLTDEYAIVCQNVQNMDQLMTLLRKLDDLAKLKRQSNIQNSYRSTNVNHNIRGNYGNNGNNREVNYGHTSNRYPTQYTHMRRNYNGYQNNSNQYDGQSRNEGTRHNNAYAESQERTRTAQVNHFQRRRSPPNRNYWTKRDSSPENWDSPVEKKTSLDSRKQEIVPQQSQEPIPRPGTSAMEM